MKKILSVIISLVMVCSMCVQAFGYDITDAYNEFAAQYPEFIKAAEGKGITKKEIISFLYDMLDYLREKNELFEITEENFEKNAIESVSVVSAREKHAALQKALLELFPNAVKEAVLYSRITDEFKPLEETVKKIFFGHNLLEIIENGQGTDNGSPGDSSVGATDIIGNNNSDKFRSFTDIFETHWAYDSVKLLASKMILNGYLDGSFKPEFTITRGEFAKIIVSVSESYDISAESDFSDVLKDSWYYKYISSAYKKGFITGYPNGSFHPEDYITRADICTIVSRALGVSHAGDVTLFSDDSTIPSYAREAVYALSGMGIINGMGNNIFSPLSMTTRAQTAHIIRKAYFPEGK